MQALAYADIAWDEFNRPLSKQFDDTYANRGNPIEEKSHVFLCGNQLAERWQDRTHFPSRASFTIAECGFGFAMSALLTWNLWRNSGRQDSTLFYISFECAPVHPNHLKKAWSQHPGLLEIGEEFLEILPPPVQGIHRRTISGGIELTLVYGKAEDYLDSMEFQADCWFLDGFAPQKNPGLWDRSFLSSITQHSAPHATLSSYSITRPLKDNLHALGWTVEKRAGCPPMREMLTAKLARQPEIRTQARSLNRASTLHAAILGGGIAGSAVAEALLRRGCSVTLIERHAALAQEASGNPAGILMPHISLDPDPISRFALRGFLHTLATLRRFAEQGIEVEHSLCGVLRLCSSNRLQALADSISETGLVDAEILKRIDENSTEAVCGLRCSMPGLFFPEGGWVRPKHFSESPLAFYRNNTNNLKLILNEQALSLRQQPGSWQILGPHQEILTQADMVVLCASNETIRFPHCAWFPLEPVRGQILSQQANEVSRCLTSVVCFDGYVLPEIENAFHVLGATFDHGDTRQDDDPNQSEQLRERVLRAVPALHFDRLGELSARVSFRSMTRDRLPMVGKVPILQSYRENPIWREGFIPEYYPGLFVSVGHGSRGLSTAHLAAEILAAEIFAEPDIIESDLKRHVEPRRFLTRLHQRGILITEESAKSWQVHYPIKSKA